jgi:hypothetical protein
MHAASCYQRLGKPIPQRQNRDAAGKIAVDVPE